jgi:hypothetical protein
MQGQPTQAEMDDFEDEHERQLSLLTGVDPHLGVRTPVDEAGWRALDGVTVLIVQILGDTFVNDEEMPA